MFRCPKCGARVGQFGRRTKDGTIRRNPHSQRVSKVPPKGNVKTGSVRTVSGGAFEMNRRRH
jgi:hypothetical protein